MPSFILRRLSTRSHSFLTSSSTITPRTLLLSTNTTQHHHHRLFTTTLVKSDNYHSGNQPPSGSSTERPARADSQDRDANSAKSSDEKILDRSQVSEKTDQPPFTEEEAQRKDKMNDPKTPEQPEEVAQRKDKQDEVMNQDKH